MDVLIIRNITIATDAGTARQFVKGETVTVSESEFRRLMIARAAAPAAVGLQIT